MKFQLREYHQQTQLLLLQGLEAVSCTLLWQARCRSGFLWYLLWPEKWAPRKSLSGHAEVSSGLWGSWKLEKNAVLRLPLMKGESSSHLQVKRAMSNEDLGQELLFLHSRSNSYGLCLWWPTIVSLPSLSERTMDQVILEQILVVLDTVFYLSDNRAEIASFPLILSKIYLQSSLPH